MAAMAAKLKELKAQLAAEKHRHESDLQQAKQTLRKAQQQAQAQQAKDHVKEAQQQAQAQQAKSALKKAQQHMQAHQQPQAPAHQQAATLSVAPVNTPQSFKDELESDKRKEQADNHQVDEEYEQANGAMDQLEKLADAVDKTTTAAVVPQDLVSVTTSLAEDEDLFDADSLMSEAKALA